MGAALFAALVVGGAFEQNDPLVDAREWVDDDAAWVTATQSGETLAEIAGVLRADAAADGCDRVASVAPASTCASHYRVAAWAEVSAIRVLRCTRPGIFEVRADARAALDAIIAGNGPAEPPPIPTCR